MTTTYRNTAQTTIQLSSIIDLIQQLAPRPFKGNGDWLRVECPLPQHVGSSSAYVHKDGSGFVCFSHCGSFNRKTFAEAMGQGQPRKLPTAPVHHKPDKKSRKTGTRPTGVTLRQLAEAKGLDIDFVKALGWQDTQYRIARDTIPAVLIPYHYQDGGYHASRYRVNLDGNPKYLWKKGARTLPYGLRDTWLATTRGYCLIVEGETDQATLQQNQEPSLGLPGVNTWRPEWGHYLATYPKPNGVKVYVWVEPGKPGHNALSPGLRMAIDIAQSFPEVYLIYAPPDAKDPNELYQLCDSPEEFRQRLEALRAEAAPLRSWAPRRLNPLRQEGTGESLADMTDDSSGCAPDSTALPISHDSRCLRYISAIKQVVGERQFQREHPGIDGEGEKTRPPSLIALYFQHLKALTADGVSNQDMRRQLSSADPSVLASHFGCDCSWMFENPAFWLDKDRLVEWLTYADGEYAKDDPYKPNPKVESLRYCLENGFATCPEHGHRHPQTGYCNLKCHAECGSHAARDMARLKIRPLVDPETLTDLPGQWRVVWLRKAIELGEASYLWQDEVNRACKAVIQAAGHKLQERLKRRKNGGSQRWHRSASFHMDYPTSYVHVKLVFFEQAAGYLDRDISRLAAELEADIIGEYTTRDPLTIQMQLVSDSVATLASVDPNNQLDDSYERQLFAAYWNGTKGERLLMPMGTLAQMIEELEPTEPEICDVPGCGQKLTWVLETEENRNQPLGKPYPQARDPGGT